MMWYSSSWETKEDDRYCGHFKSVVEKKASVSYWSYIAKVNADNLTNMLYKKTRPRRYVWRQYAGSG